MARNLATTNNLGDELRNITFEYEIFLKRGGDGSTAGDLAAQAPDELSAASPLPKDQSQLKYFFDSHMKAGQHSLIKSDLDAAYGSYLKSAAAAQHLAEPLLAAKSATSLGIVSFKQKQYHKAELWFKYALARHNSNRTNPISYAASKGLTQAYIEQKHFKQAEQSAKQLITDAQILDEANESETRIAHGLLATIATQQGNYDSALLSYLNVYESCRKHLPVCNQETIISLCDAVNCLWALGRKGQCKELMQRFVNDARKQDKNNRLFAARQLDSYANHLRQDRRLPDEGAIFSKAAEQLRVFR